MCAHFCTLFEQALCSFTHSRKLSFSSSSIAVFAASGIRIHWLATRSGTRINRNAHHYLDRRLLSSVLATPSPAFGFLRTHPRCGTNRLLSLARGIAPTRGLHQIAGSTFTLLPERGWNKQRWAWAQYTSSAFLGSSFYFISGDRGAYHPNNSLIDNLDCSCSHALTCLNSCGNSKRLCFG